MNGDAQLRRRQQLLLSLKSRPQEYDFCNATGTTLGKGHGLRKALGLVFCLSAIGGIPLTPVTTASEKLLFPSPPSSHSRRLAQSPNSCPALVHNTQIGK